MGVRFTIGHVGGGTTEIDVPAGKVDGVLTSLLEELYGSDDEHYQAYVNNSAEESITIFDGGLMVLDSLSYGSPAASRHHRPATMAKAVAVLNAFVHQKRRSYSPKFKSEMPPELSGLNFLLVGMGEFALHRAAWAGNLSRVKSLVEAGHDVNQLTEEGTTPLMGAVSEGHTEICRLLLKHGADVTVRWPKDGWGTADWSLLRMARKEKQTEIVKLLERAGAPE